MTEEHEVVIQFRNVTKTFDLFKNDKQRLKSLLFHNTNAKKKVAIDNLSFDIRQGEAVAILGKNGAGKSTMLKMISGVTFPTVGSVRVTGRVSALLEVSGGFDPELSGPGEYLFPRRAAGHQPGGAEGDGAGPLWLFRSWAAISICPSAPIPAV